jgi:hypothetical protein
MIINLYYLNKNKNNLIEIDCNFNNLKYIENIIIIFIKIYNYYLFLNK